MAHVAISYQCKLSLLVVSLCRGIITAVGASTSDSCQLARRQVRQVTLCIRPRSASSTDRGQLIGATGPLTRGQLQVSLQQHSEANSVCFVTVFVNWCEHIHNRLATNLIGDNAVDHRLPVDLNQVINHLGSKLHGHTHPMFLPRT
jgi:hypothetical protein